jgi:hypothetical protein
VVVHIGTIAEKKPGDITRKSVIAPGERDDCPHWGTTAIGAKGVNGSGEIREHGRCKPASQNFGSPTYALRLSGGLAIASGKLPIRKTNVQSGCPQLHASKSPIAAYSAGGVGTRGTTPEAI